MGYLMDIEQLKLVLATVQGVSGDAFKVGAIYIGAQFLKEIVGYGMGGVVLFTGYKAAKLIIAAINSNTDAVRGFLSIRRSLNIAAYGEHDGFVNERTVSETVACVEGLMKKLNKEEA